VSGSKFQTNVHDHESQGNVVKLLTVCWAIL